MGFRSLLARLRPRRLSAEEAAHRAMERHEAEQTMRREIERAYLEDDLARPGGRSSRFVR